MTDLELELTEAVPLAHAAVARVAADAQVRVLFFKGPVAALQGLRPTRASLDVDVLVDPTRLAVLAGALTALGWVDEHPYSTPTAATYSRTHRHPNWPCELDLHVTFPGLYAPEQDVFEELWSRHETVEVAARVVPCPDVQAHALLLALNSLRDPREMSKASQLTELERRVSDSFGEPELRGLGELARVLGAADTAAPFLLNVGAPNTGIGSTAAEDLRAWRLRTQPEWRVATWMDGLRREPLRARPRYLWRALVLSDEELRMAYPALPPGRLPLLKARISRLRRGMAALPGAVRNVRDTDVAADGVEGRTAEVVVATLLRPEGETGVQTHMQALVAHLRAEGRPATVVTPFSDTSRLVRPVFALRLPLRWVIRSLSVRWYRHWHAHYLRRALRRHLRTAAPDRVVYAQCPVSADVALSLREAEPVVMVAHFNVSQADEWAARGEIPQDGRCYEAIRAFEAEVLPRLDGIVYVSEWSGRLLRDRIPALAAVPSATVPNFVDVRRHGVADPAVTGDLVSVGTLEPRKNQSYLLDVLQAAEARGHRYTLSLVGDGPSRAAWERRAADLGLADRVTFLGFRPDARAVVAGHRAYVHAALMENLPLALIEAMAEGLPVVAPAVGGIPSMLTEGVEGAFWPLDDPDAAAQLLISLLSTPARVEQMGAAARVRVEQDYAAEVVVPRLEAFLDDVVRLSGRSLRSLR